MRLPVSRMFQRTIFACRSLKTDADLLLVEARLGAPAGKSAAITFALTASTAA